MLDKAATREASSSQPSQQAASAKEPLQNSNTDTSKKTLEAGRVPIHIHVEADITKGKYHDYDTFINAEASHLLKLYIEDRNRGNR